MNATELAETLGRMYREAPKGESVVMIHLFGVRHAADIRASGTSPTDLAIAAGLSDSYGVEINKAMNLAKYVEPKRTNC